MSELKAFDITVAEEGYCEGVVKYRRAVYGKSEADKVIAHQKYRRCLTMTRWCDSERDIFNLTPKFAKVEFYRKWHRRWLELAEKFKEVK